VSDLIERAKAALEGATKGRRVQFSPRFCKEAEGTPFSEWDTSHETSVIRPDGTRYRGYSVHRHADDAALDNLAPDLARALIAADDLAQKAKHVCDVLEADNGHAPVALKEALAAYRAAISQEPDT
jgi:hypothetical protein